MGYKRITKKKYRVSREERLEMHLAHKYRRVPIYEHPDLWKLGDWMRWSAISSQSKKDNSERMKWFESPNAEGYLKL